MDNCKIVQLDKFNQLIITEDKEFFILTEISLNLRKVAKYNVEKLFFGKPRFKSLEDLVASFVRFADGESCFTLTEENHIADFYRLSITKTESKDQYGKMVTTNYKLNREAIGAEKAIDAAIKGEASEYDNTIFA